MSLETGTVHHGGNCMALNVAREDHANPIEVDHLVLEVGKPAG